MAESKPLLLTVREAAKLLRVGKGTAYELAAEGLIPVLRVGRRILIPREALVRWIEGQGEAFLRNVSGPSVWSTEEHLGSEEP